MTETITGKTDIETAKLGPKMYMKMHLTMDIITDKADIITNINWA
jgi:hypothetical protein